MSSSNTPVKAEAVAEDEAYAVVGELELHLPGQKFPTPSFTGDRVFYSSLLEQRPDSVMAQEWCVQYGVLDQEVAAKFYAAMLTRKGASGNGTTFSPSPVKVAAAAKKAPAKKSPAKKATATKAKKETKPAAKKAAPKKKAASKKKKGDEEEGGDDKEENE